MDLNLCIVCGFSNAIVMDVVRKDMMNIFVDRC